MVSLRHFVFGLVMFCGVVPVASAQDKGDVGLVVESPGSVGIIWHLSDRVAIRPTIGFTHRSVTAEPEVIGDLSTSATTVAFDISALFYVAKWDRLQAYVSPAFGRTLLSAETDLGEESSFRVAGLFGAQYAVSDRFSVFGATGLLYQRSSLENTLGGPLSFTVKTTATAISSESKVGVILYF